MSSINRIYAEFCDRHPLPPAVNGALVTCLVALWLIGIVLASTSTLWSGQ